MRGFLFLLFFIPRPNLFPRAFFAAARRHRWLSPAAGVMQTLLTLHLLDGSPVLCGTLQPADEEAMKKAGVEILDLPASGAYPGLHWLAPPPAPPLRAVYCKTYTKVEMASSGGRFHAGWSLSSFIEAWPACIDAEQLLASPQAAFLVEAGEISAEAHAIMQRRLLAKHAGASIC